MKTYLEALDLWEAVEEDYEIPQLPNNPSAAQIKNQKEKKAMKSKVKACLFAAVSIAVFTRVMSLSSAKAIWDYLKGEYAGNERVKAQEQRRLMWQDTIVEGALPAKHHDTRKNFKKNFNKFQPQNSGSHTSNHVQKKCDNAKKKYPPCRHCGKLGHPPFKCWKRPDAKCNICNQHGHEAVICKNKFQKHKEDAKFADEDDTDQMFVAARFSTKSPSESWLIDSGCKNHMTYEKSLFKEFVPTNVSKVRIGNGVYIAAKGRGTIAITTISCTKTISDVLYVPDIDQNLLSVGQLIEKGLKVSFESGHCLVFDATGREILRVKMRGKSFSFDPSDEGQMAYNNKWIIQRSGIND
ncbi:uncharacterized protein LOC141680013 [Apium graveolens]|uniref:uncharacterized protein LOC141680013 n=1 Tax=Apium graveolens TaxID=4045 RepID=UPI003D790AF7